MWTAKAKQMNNGRWAILFIETQGRWESIRYGWRELASRLPMGEKEFKKRAQAMGGTLEKTIGEKKNGLAGIGFAELTTMTFESEELANMAIAELITPSFMALNIALNQI